MSVQQWGPLLAQPGDVTFYNIGSLQVRGFSKLLVEPKTFVLFLNPVYVADVNINFLRQCFLYFLKPRTTLSKK